MGYSNRGDRCEGLYIKQVGSTTLLVVSLTESFEAYHTESGKALRIAWSKPPGTGPLHIRAQGIQRRLYYRMDTFQPGDKGSFTWPSDVLASLHISKDDIGVLGWSRLPIGATEEDVYIPVRVSQEGGLPHPGSFTLVILPGVELSEVYVSLAPTGPDGKPKQFLKDGEKLGYGYYPAERGIEIPISGLKEKGIYYMQIGATLRTGGSSTIELWIYNPSPDE